MITLDEMTSKLDEVAEMSDMMGNPAALTRDDMWANSGDFRPGEEDLLMEALSRRFDCGLPELRAVTDRPGNFQTPFADAYGYVLYVIHDSKTGRRIFAIGQSGYKFDD